MKEGQQAVACPAREKTGMPSSSRARSKKGKRPSFIVHEKTGMPSLSRARPKKGNRPLFVVRKKTGMPSTIVVSCAVKEGQHAIHFRGREDGDAIIIPCVVKEWQQVVLCCVGTHPPIF